MTVDPALAQAIATIHARIDQRVTKDVHAAEVGSMKQDIHEIKQQMIRDATERSQNARLQVTIAVMALLAVVTSAVNVWLTVGGGG